MATFPKECAIVSKTSAAEDLVASEIRTTTSPTAGGTNIFRNPRETLNWLQPPKEAQGQSLESVIHVPSRRYHEHRQISSLGTSFAYALPSEHHHHYCHYRRLRNQYHNRQRPGLQPSSLRLVGVTQSHYTPSSATSLSRGLRFNPKFTTGLPQPLLMMIIMFVVAFSGHAVFASQRDASKTEDMLGMSTNANAIPNTMSAAASHGGNTNNVSNGNVHFYNANINSLTAHPATESRLGLTTGSSVGSGSSTVPSTTSLTTAATTLAAGSGGGATGSNSFSATSRNTIEVLDDGRGGPYFDRPASKNITALLGKTAYLNCRVKNLGNKTMLLQVSWVRHRDIHLLTVGRYTYTSDQRFRAIHQPQTEDWILQIKYPQHRDSGIYECQVSTTPHMSHYIHLNVVEPSTEIIGAPDLYIESGSTINLTCVILNSPEPPAYIFWNHNNAIINYDSPRGGVSVVTNKGETTTSFLLIKSARPSDSGHYQCNPSNAKPKSVTVHVLNGVSHSVSRGVPSSNAARGTGATANVSGALSVGLPVDLLLQLSVWQTLYVAASISQLMRLLRRLLGASLAMAVAAVFCGRRNKSGRLEFEFMEEVEEVEGVEGLEEEVLLPTKDRRNTSQCRRHCGKARQEIWKQQFERTKVERILRAAHLHRAAPIKLKTSECDGQDRLRRVSQNDSALANQCDVTKCEPTAQRLFISCRPSTCPSSPTSPNILTPRNRTT